MKKNKKNTEKINNTDKLYPLNQSKRRQERLEKEKKNKEKSRNALFRKRVREASEKKAPKTLRTKAYYRFSSDYPSTVSPDGFRENHYEKNVLSNKKRILTALVCILLFLFSFTAIQTAAHLSKKPLKEDTAATVTENDSLTACHISPEDLASKTSDEIISEIKSSNCNTAIIEFKSEYGYVYFDIGSFTGASADKRINSAWDKLKAINEAGIKSIAYISCFKDTIAASSSSGMEVSTSAGYTFKDNEGACWLDPFSDKANEYVLNIIKKAAEGGFTYILLDNICYPTDYSVASPLFNSSDTEADKNKALISFIDSAVKTAGKEKIITLCDISGFASLSQIPNEKYAGALLSSSCIAFSVDLRQNKQYNEQLINSDLIKYIEEMPLAFILDAGALAKNSLQNQKEASVVLAVIDKELENAEDFVIHAGIENIIFW